MTGNTEVYKMDKMVDHVRGGQRGRGGDPTEQARTRACVKSKKVKASVLACLSNMNHED